MSLAIKSRRRVLSVYFTTGLDLQPGITVKWPDHQGHRDGS